MGRESKGRRKETVLLTTPGSLSYVRDFVCLSDALLRNARPESGHGDGQGPLPSPWSAQRGTPEVVQCPFCVTVQVRIDLAGWDEDSVSKLKTFAPAWGLCVCL